MLTSSLYVSGRNEKGQLGHGDTKRLEAPKLIEALADEVVVAAACGRNHTLALTGRSSAGAGVRQRQVETAATCVFLINT